MFNILIASALIGQYAGATQCGAHQTVYRAATQTYAAQSYPTQAYHAQALLVPAVQVLIAENPYFIQTVAPAARLEVKVQAAQTAQAQQADLSAQVAELRTLIQQMAVAKPAVQAPPAQQPPAAVAAQADPPAAQPPPPAQTIDDEPLLAVRPTRAAPGQDELQRRLQSCVECHHGSSARGGFRMFLDDGRMAQFTDDDRQRIDTQLFKGLMPKPKRGQPLKPFSGAEWQAVHDLMFNGGAERGKTANHHTVTQR